MWCYTGHGHRSRHKTIGQWDVVDVPIAAQEEIGRENNAIFRKVVITDLEYVVLDEFIHYSHA